MNNGSPLTFRESMNALLTKKLLVRYVSQPDRYLAGQYCSVDSFDFR